MRILFTGFDPFGGEKINPAGEAVKMMKNEIQGAEILKLEVPTVFGKAGEVLKKAVEQYRPDAVVCVGQAGGRAAITPEMIAVNIMDARIPDNAGIFRKIYRKSRICGDDTNRVTHVKERFFRHFTFFDKPKIRKQSQWQSQLQ